MSKLGFDSVTLQVAEFEVEVLLEEDQFEKELKIFAKDYDLTIEEARELVANVASMKAKHEILHPGRPFEW